ncbi:MAG: leucyl aminopeptidase [Bacteroidetes bacterium]|nr:leucyl aminopeptidase [Bacteroidota bacterium]
MNIKIQSVKSLKNNEVNQVIPVFKIEQIHELELESNEKDFILKIFKSDKSRCFAINRYHYWIFVHYIKPDNDPGRLRENYRQAGDNLLQYLRENNLNEIVITDLFHNPEAILDYTEGLILGSYSFTKYKTENKNGFNLDKVTLVSTGISAKQTNELSSVCRSVFFCRDLVNEPVSYLNAVRLASIIREEAEKKGIVTEVFNKKKIESLKMGGLLAVNKGSIDPPTFTVMEWKPDNARNSKPIILVGKGVVYDTGGLNIKTGTFMDDMKSDMAGAATMASVMFAIADNHLPVHVIALLPATDNRPDGNAYVPGDVIKMHNGMTVEVLNTDAEGRMILADALSYACRYNPELVINAATLTGAAARAIGIYGIVAMETKAASWMDKLKTSGLSTYERIAEFPFWDEYGDLIKSDVADIKNIGGPEAGMITAGKFLERFTDYPFIHLDIAGVAFYGKKDTYRSKGGTGFGVRLLYNFFKQMTSAD